ncbi:hypothetical protein DN752_20955 [Echinicola strongylocentroti]|uniref:Uncharacterized protein n=1 Tax=Echinicola strongylocentroti TaxID=1795355 RepID=A0A2Z4IMS7_9BACT|nr:hypothetical protein [Echinicola strongylocentroti]AWW32412.1 hypothetical protein DN752_20955 [Echinicola strongylocentroti]
MTTTISSDNQGADDMLFNYLHGYMRHIMRKDHHDLRRNMEQLFVTLEQLIKDFHKSNPGYRKPVGLHITFNRPSCCPATFRISYLKNEIIIKPKHHEKSNQNNHSAVPVDSDHLMLLREDSHGKADREEAAKRKKF